MIESKLVPTMRKTRVLIVDDHPLVREGIAGRIARNPDLQICGEAATVTEALELVRSAKPEVVIIDLALKNSHGLDLIKQIQSHYPQIKMLVCSMYEEKLYAERCLHAGAMGYVHKHELSDKVLEAIQHILKGRLYLSEAMTEKLLHKSIGAKCEEGSAIDRLSDRELEIFELIGRGLTTRQIAARLFLSVKTIETHRENIKAKLKLDNSTALNAE